MLNFPQKSLALERLCFSFYPFPVNIDTHLYKKFVQAHNSKGISRIHRFSSLCVKQQKALLGLFNPAMCWTISLCLKTIITSWVFYDGIVGMVWQKKSQTYKYFQILSQDRLGCSLILYRRLTNNKSLCHSNPFHKRNIYFRFTDLQTLDLEHSVTYFNLQTSTKLAGGSWVEQLSWVESFFLTTLC